MLPFYDSGSGTFYDLRHYTMKTSPKVLQENSSNVFRLSTAIPLILKFLAMEYTCLGFLSGSADLLRRNQGRGPFLAKDVNLFGRELLPDSPSHSFGPGVAGLFPALLFIL